MVESISSVLNLIDHGDCEATTSVFEAKFLVRTPHLQLAAITYASTTKMVEVINIIDDSDDDIQIPGGCKLSLFWASSV